MQILSMNLQTAGEEPQRFFLTEPSQSWLFFPLCSLRAEIFFIFQWKLVFLKYEVRDLYRNLDEGCQNKVHLQKHLLPRLKELKTLQNVEQNARSSASQTNYKKDASNTDDPKVRELHLSKTSPYEKCLQGR